MNPTKRNALSITRIIAAAASLALPAISLAQGQIDAGRSNDASNRVGSGGRNDSYVAPNRYSNNIINTGNQVITGNVTMGRGFRDGVGYTNPYALRVPTAGIGSDNFIKNSAGVPQPYSREPIPNQSVPFYGASQTATPPPGYQLSPNRGGFVPTPPVGAPRGVEDQRLGVVDLNQPISPAVGPNTLVTRGSLTPGAGAAAAGAEATQPGIITGSSLYGVREWNPRDPADRLFLESMVRDQNNALDRLRLDPREVQRMREEVQKYLGEDTQQQNGQGAGTGTTGTGTGSGIGQGAAPGQAGPGARRSGGDFTLDPLGRSFDSPSEGALNNRPLDSRVQTAQLEPGLDTQQSTRMRLLGQAQRTSARYSELNKRLEQYYDERRKTDADFARDFNEAVRAKKQAENAADPNKAPGGVGQGGINNVGPLPGAGGAGAGAVKPGDAAAKPPIKKPAPIKVGTLSEGVKVEGLANLMKKAETLMKDGRFVSALDQYEAAEAVQPNNPLIWLGKANAELGAGLFARADAHLRQAFGTDKALLLGQYDLRGMLGEQRLEKLVADLKDLTVKDQKGTTPVWLLAYISYNSGNERMALGFLDLAEKRAGGQDPFFKTVREHWALPEGEQPQKEPAAEKPAENK
jgi:tetratricopeptide (TPR) repeat protein